MSDQGLHFLNIVVFLLGLPLVIGSHGQNARWCTQSTGESNKCAAMKTKFAGKGLEPEIECVTGMSAQDCMAKIRDNNADLITLDGGDVYDAGRDFDMVPIMEEVYVEGKRGYYAVAVVKKNNPDITINNLKGKKSCHTGISKTAGWNVPIGFLIENDHITPVDCKQDIQSAGQFFSASCVPGVLTDKYNPDGNNPSNLCAQCIGGCERNSHEPYYNYAGAFRCMVEGAGDVAFIKPQTVLENTDNKNQDSWALNLASTDFELLCPDGTRKAVTEAANCNLAQVPPHAVMTGSTRKLEEIKAFQDLLISAQKIFGNDGNTNTFTMFDSTAWYGSDYLFKNSALYLDKVTNQNYEQFLGSSYVKTIEGIGKCPENTVRWCVISDIELKKCRNMSAAFKTQRLTPEISCLLEVDHNACIKSIADDEADVVTLDGGDIYHAGKKYELRPLMAELYKSPGDAVYYAVAVVKATSTFNIDELKDKKSCHTGIMKTSGWVVPIGFLIDNGDIAVAKGCDVPSAVGDFFSASCVPGAKSSSYDPDKTNPDILCKLCAGTGDNNCQRSSVEPYYDYSGAFRCLVEDAGEVAFVKHVTVEDTTTGEYPWASGVTKSDYKLLCRDGTRADIDDWKNCYLAKVPSHALVTSKMKTNTERTEITDLLSSALTHFGHDSNSRGFRLFDSAGYLGKDGNPGSNLLFKDSTVTLKAVGVNDKYDDYLSPEYLKDLDAISCDQPGGTANLSAPFFLVTLMAVLALILVAI